ncbi:MAG: hypothetical protein C5B50_17900 [Verrucomicrobia bacterium]|nr:MAG: hypothetical protein C5B50_17900 [Verrucomicrobiota bacterium]
MSPQITQDPSNTVVAAGSALNLSLAAIGTPPLSYQWYKSAGAISGATSTNYVINPAQTNNTDSYFAIVTNVYGSATSHVANVVVYVPVNISQQPQNQAVPAGGTAMFNVQASGFPAPTYQWTFRGTNWIGRTSNPLIISNVNLSNLGTYAVLVSNAGSSQLSSNAILSMSPSITMSYTGATGIWGRSAVLSVGAIGSGLTYQWYENGVAIGSATNSSYTFSTVQLTNGGNYSVVVSSPYGSVTNSAQFKVIPASMDVGTCASIDIGGVIGSNYMIQGSYYPGGMFGTTNTWMTLTNLTLVQNPELWVDTSANAFRAGTRYYQVLPVPASTNQAKVACINIGGVAGYSYIIQRTDDVLNTNAWMTLTNLVLQQNQQVWADTSTNAPTTGVRCYRILPGQ